MADTDPHAVAPPSTLLRIYCGLMLLIGAYSGYVLWTTSSEARAYEMADESAKRVLGGADASPNQEPRRTPVRTLCVGILRCVETRKQATSRRAMNLDVAIEMVKEMAYVMGLTALELQPDVASDDRARREYAESALSATFEKTELVRLASFLYNVEASSTSLRTLELKWALLPESQSNDPTFSFGGRIDRPTVRIGQRFPLRTSPK